jgi:antitoxin HicB
VEAERWAIVAQLAEELAARRRVATGMSNDLSPVRLAKRRGTRQTLDVSASQCRVLLEPDADGGYVVVVPALPGCYSQAETVEEALAYAREAIALTVKDLSAHGEPVPAPSSTSCT